jgi:hypothetical protein
MSGQDPDKIIDELFDLYGKYFELEEKRRKKVDRQGKPLLGSEKEEQKLRREVSVIENQIEDVLKGFLEKKQIMTKPKLGPQEGIDLQVSIEAVIGSFELGDKGKSKNKSVPLGQIYVLSHGYDASCMDEFPEIYLAGDTIITDHNKEAQYFVAVMSEFPGTISCVIRQSLAAISLEEGEPARASFIVPVRLFDPIKTLRRSKGDWTSPKGRRSIHTDLKEQLEHRLHEILEDKIQLWSAEKQEVLNYIFSILNRHLGEWGLRIDTRTVSLIRKYPKMLYEIVLQFAKGERLLLEDVAAGKREMIISEVGISNEEITTIQAIAAQREKGEGAGLFLVTRDGPKPLKNKVSDWLKIQGLASAANYVSSLYSGKHSERDVKLSEQVLFFAFRNPVLGLGEVLYRCIAQNEVRQKGL